jgi:hypothetical protein
MKYEWSWIFGFVAVAFVFFLFQSAETAAHAGWAFLACGVVSYHRLIITGHRARSRVTQPTAVTAHRLQVAVLTGSTLIGVLGVEVAVRKAGGLWGDPWVIFFHLLFVLGSSLAFYEARFVHTGLRNPLKHRRYVYSFLVFYLATFATGSKLVFERFPPAWMG